MSGETFELLGETIPVVAQPINRLATRLEELGDLFKPDSEINVSTIAGSMYDLLVTLAPEVEARIPRYRWLGFASREEMESSERTFGPLDTVTVPEVREAFRVARNVNGWDVLSGFSKLVDPTLAKALVSGFLEDAAREMSRERSRTISSTSRSQNGERGSTSSLVPSPTLESSEAGPSRESKPLSAVATSPDENAPT